MSSSEMRCGADGGLDCLSACLEEKYLIHNVALRLHWGVCIYAYIEACWIGWHNAVSVLLFFTPNCEI